jgi:hypothetical protein
VPRPHGPEGRRLRSMCAVVVVVAVMLLLVVAAAVRFATPAWAGSAQIHEVPQSNQGPDYCGEDVTFTYKVPDTVALPGKIPFTFSWRARVEGPQSCGGGSGGPFRAGMPSMLLWPVDLTLPRACLVIDETDWESNLRLNQLVPTSPPTHPSPWEPSPGPGPQADGQGSNVAGNPYGADGSGFYSAQTSDRPYLLPGRYYVLMEGAGATFHAYTGCGDVDASYPIVDISWRGTAEPGSSVPTTADLSPAGSSVTTGAALPAATGSGASGGGSTPIGLVLGLVGAGVVLLLLVTTAGVRIVQYPRGQYDAIVGYLQSEKGMTEAEAKNQYTEWAAAGSLDDPSFVQKMIHPNGPYNPTPIDLEDVTAIHVIKDPKTGEISYKVTMNTGSGTMVTSVEG